jgi:hypothetical protein
MASTVQVGPLACMPVAFGQWSTVSAADTITTGLSKIAAVIVSFDDDATLGDGLVTASWSQAGTPGQFILKTWQFTSNANPTPIAATVFTKKVNWIAFGQP